VESYFEHLSHKGKRENKAVCCSKRELSASFLVLTRVVGRGCLIKVQREGDYISLKPSKELDMPPYHGAQERVGTAF